MLSLFSLRSIDSGAYKSPLGGLPRLARRTTAALCLLVGMLAVSTVSADHDLAKQSQNPIGTLISLPFENNVFFDIGPSNTEAYVLNLKPVYPVRAK